ncbi:MAG: PASTA domain-containing protein [Lachnospiraceae bacterium]|nr:PASTA domain-containing protein [Lachnospiraceae bacterium]
MLSEGLVLAERYEVIGKIGAGGMSDVYKAKDHKLNRFVAIKVLKSEFSENRSFVSKFRVEAQSAAILMHPNIVNVYDVGDEDGLYYIVMELVEGITLKKYIEKKLRLSVKEAVSIAINVSMGIESAHNNHIIHRDIKPQNIIISKDGKVKVTDFGIARAVSSDTITQNAMGSVHYTSPEQARGGYSDEKSDIYSLGITMFEMLTGRVPFDGETTVAIAIKHIQEELPSPREYVDDIPVSVEQIIYKCCQKNAARRYQNMGELIVDLKKSLITPDENFVVIPDLETKGHTRMATTDDIASIRTQTGHLASLDEEILSKGRPVKRRPEEESVEEEYDDGYYPEESDGDYDPDSYEEPEYEEEEYEEEEYEEEEYEEAPVRTGKQAPARRRKTPPKKRTNKRTPAPAKKKKRPEPAKRPVREKKVKDDYDDDSLDPTTEKIMSILGIVAAIIIAFIAIFIASRMLGVFNTAEKTPDTEETEGESASYVVMPALTGMSFDDAKAKLTSMGLEVQATYVSSETVEKNQVVAQSIAEGENVLTGSVVELSVSSGKDGVAIPDVIGKSEAEARVALEQEGFEMVKDESASDTVPKDCVISQNPAAGESVQKGATVTVIISTGPSNDKVSIPDLRGITEENAKAALAAAELTVGTVAEVNSETIPVGCVVSQSPGALTEVAKGTAVDLSVSSGPLESEPLIVLYSCNFNVNAPSAYAGGPATVSLTQTETGTVLFRTTTTSFPVSINLTNIQGSPDCTISIKYSIDNTVIHENEDGSIESHTSTEEKTETQPVTLTRQS